MWVGCDLVEAYAHDEEVQEEVGPDYEDGDAYGLLEALEEDGAEERQEHERDDDLPAVQEGGH